MGDYSKWVLDLANGEALDHANTPVQSPEFPNDTEVEVADGSLKPLRAFTLRPLTPRGFDAVAVTSKFIFAKRTWLTYYDLWFRAHSEVTVVDRSLRQIVWHTDGRNVAVIASPTHLIVCNDNDTTAFLPDASRPNEITEFYAAIRDGNIEKMVQLFPAWKRSHLFDLGGEDPMTSAASNGQLAVVDKLLAMQISPNSKAANGYSPLIAALNQHHPEIVSVLLDAGADPNYDPPEWDAPLGEGAETASGATMRLLIQHGARLDTRSKFNRDTALHHAVMYRNYEAIEALLKAGANPAIKDDHGETASDKAYRDECVTHLFAGGSLSDLPEACAPPKRESVTGTIINLAP